MLVESLVGNRETSVVALTTLPNTNDLWILAGEPRKYRLHVDPGCKWLKEL